MGRPRVSDALKRARGTFRPDRAVKASSGSEAESVPPPPPSHLKRVGKECWLAVTSQCHYTSDLLGLLVTGCEQRQLYAKALDVVNSEGLTITNAAGVVRPHPAAGIARDALKEYRAIMAQLGIRGGTVEGDDA